MKRHEIFEELNRINDPVKDYAKILSNLHYTHFFMMDQYKRILASYDLTSTQSNVLGIIGHFFPLSVSLEEIKEMVLEPNADVSRAVARLSEKGFVEKVVNIKNRRKVSILITSAGLKTIDKLQADKKLKKFTAAFSLKEARQFSKALAKLRGEK